MTSVVLVSPSAKPGGAERAFASLVRHLPAHGFEPLSVLLERGPLEDWLAEAGCKVALGPAGDPEDGAAAVEFVRSRLKQVQAGAVVSSKWDGHLIGGAAGLAASVPAIWWQHDIARRREDPRELWAAAVPAAAVVCVSEYASRAQKRLTPAARVVSVHAGVPVAEIAARRGSGPSVREALGWLEHPLVGLVGRLESWKGQELFLRAARFVAARRPEVRFVIVGGAILGNEGSYPDDLRQLADELALSDRVHFAGHQADVYPWFDALDVAVHASDGEPFGLVVTEAMALGKPVVAARSGGPTEIIEPGKSGLLVPRQPRAMAAAILRLLENTKLAARIGAEAQRRVRAFSEERMATGFAAVLRSVLARAESPTPR